MANHPEQEYTVSDRRIRFDEPDPIGAEAVAARPAPAATTGSERPAGTQHPTGLQRPQERVASEGAPASDAFLALLEMLAAPALMHLGEAGGGPSGPAGLAGGRRPVNLPAAREFIEVLTVLETKTQGNLAPAEQTVLKDLLFTLKMKYVEASKRTGAAR